MNSVQIIHNKSILVGECSLEGLIAFPDFNGHNHLEYSHYDPEPKIIEELKLHLTGLQITIVLGTWCGDSLRQVPRFLKILDLLQIAENDITVIAVDQAKTIPGDLISKLGIEKVPTFFIYNDGQEVGRIVETPIETLEKDILYLLTQ
jgi:thiol-disulfide isomerase/thioredoxin